MMLFRQFIVILVGIGLILFIQASLLSPARAQTTKDDEIDFGTFEVLKEFPSVEPAIDKFIDKDTKTPLVRAISLIANVLIAAIVVIGMMVVIFAGYLYMTAGGNSSQIDSSKKWLGAALLGIVLALTTWLILNTISPQFLPTTDPVL